MLSSSRSQRQPLDFQTAFYIFIYQTLLSKATKNKYICQMKEKQKYIAVGTVRMFIEPSVTRNRLLEKIINYQPFINNNYNQSPCNQQKLIRDPLSHYLRVTISPFKRCCFSFVDFSSLSFFTFLPDSTRGTSVRLRRALEE